MRVLVVDDSGVMRKIVIRGLDSCGVTTILEAADGKEAWDLFQAHTFDMVLTDWNMPNMNGLELVQAIRAEGHKVPIMMITTETEKSQVLAAIQAGVNDYLVKPFDQETLQVKIGRVLPKPANA